MNWKIVVVTGLILSVAGIGSASAMMMGGGMGFSRGMGWNWFGQAGYGMGYGMMDTPYRSDMPAGYDYGDMHEYCDSMMEEYWGYGHTDQPAGNEQNAYPYMPGYRTQGLSSLFSILSFGL